MELRRIAIRLFESNFPEPSDAILKIESAGNETSDDSGARGTDGGEEGEVSDALVGGNGEVFEVRRIAAKSKSKSKSLYTNAVSSARGNYGVNNRSPANAPSKGASSSGKNSTVAIKCWRFGQSDHYWGNCHLPWQKNLAFGPKPPELVKTPDAALFMVENDADVPASAPSKEPVDKPISPAPPGSSGQIRYTEEEWISKYNLAMNSVLTCSHKDESIHMQCLVHMVKTEPLPNIVIDSGATSNVVGKSWVQEYGKRESFPVLPSSNRSFRFGDSLVFVSQNIVRFKLWIPRRKCNREYDVLGMDIAADLIECELPLLLSRAFLKSLKCSIQFGRNLLILEDKSVISLALASNGHLMLPCSVAQESVSMVDVHVADASLSLNERIMSLDLARKLHLHLAHASESVMKRVAKTAGYIVSDDILRPLMGQCSRHSTFAKPQSPLISSYIPAYPGHTLCLDIFYSPADNRRARPFLLICCSLTRFCVVRSLASVRPLTVIHIVLVFWYAYFGKAERVLADQGPGFVGQEWGIFSESWDTVLILAPKNSARSNGLAERQIDLIKSGFVRLRESEPTSTITETLQRTVLARNLTPLLSTGVCPLQGMTGRADILGVLDRLPQIADADAAESEEGRLLLIHQQHVRQLAELRSWMCRREAEIAIQVCNNRQLRTGMSFILT